jgi:hypothetical protein
LAEGIGDMNRTTLKRSTPSNRPSPRADRISRPEINKLVLDPISGNGAKNLAIEPPNKSTLGIAELRRVLKQGVEDWLEVKCQPADGLKHIGGGDLLLQGFRQFPRAHL